ncbi:GldM C-terminal domain-containing protein [Chryseobacterium soldanellicola]|uniref:GldM C-terminal domain-containing protein n=1 Tax=Chryseobacterium soldanellicola TaxID=311333 RepID=A0A1H1AGD2_9FLAO|nr:GldM C-terminal domain-containing protein [Chryseobacterium soldanellicola]
MKKNILYIFMLCTCIYCTSKKHISSSKDPSVKSVIENERLNILYRGIKNYLTIYVPQSDSITVSGLGVYKEGENKYSIAPSTGTSMEITIISFVKGKEIIEKREFRIVNLEKAFASIGNKIGKITLSKEELATSKIEYFIPQFVMKLGRVGKFRYQINDEEPTVNYGDEFNKSAKEKIYNMKSGDSMIIDNLNSNPELQNVDLKKVTELVIDIK